MSAVFLTSDLIFKLYCASESPVSDNRFFFNDCKVRQINPAIFIFELLEPTSDLLLG